MKIIFKLCPLLFLLTTAYTPPPIMPNYCSLEFCVDYGVLISDELRGSFLSKMTLLEHDDKSWMQLSHYDFGSISILGRFALRKHRLL